MQHARTVYNSIIYGNTARVAAIIGKDPFLVTILVPFPNDTHNSSYGNITNDPIFVDAAFHLSAASPCRGAGSSLYATGTDMTASMKSPPSMGAE